MPSNYFYDLIVIRFLVNHRIAFSSVRLLSFEVHYLKITLFEKGLSDTLVTRDVGFVTPQ